MRPLFMYSRALNYRWMLFLAVLLCFIANANANDPIKNGNPYDGLIRKGRKIAMHRGVTSPQNQIKHKNFTPNIAGVDVGIIKTANKSTAVIGELVTFTLKIFNEGTSPATNVVVKDPIPTGTTYVSSSPIGAYTQNTGQWWGGTIPAGDTVTFTYTVRIETDGVTISQAEVESMDGTDDDSAPSNGIVTEDDWASACVSVPMYYCNSSQIQIEVEAPLGFTSYKWYKNGILVDTNRIYTIVDFGDYHYQASVAPNNCPVELCCPIQVQQKCLAVGNLVWADTNNNGIKDPTESGIANIEVVLYSTGTDSLKNSNDVALDTILTDVNGIYNFNNLAEGYYYVKLQNVPTTYSSSTGDGIYDNDHTGAYENGPSPDNNLNNVDDGTEMVGTGMIMTGVFNLTYDAEPTNDDDTDPNTNLTVDFGLYTPQVFDLALVKTLKAGQTASFKPGDLVTFTINVLNQGTVTAYDVNVVDYIPSGLTLTDAAWTLNGSSATRTIASIAANSSSSVDISFTIDANFSGTSLVNLSEISSADDNTNPNDTPPTDVDSTPDTNPTNDGTPKDDVVNENGKTGGDEDDHDPATIIIVQPTPTLALGNVVFNDTNNNGIKDNGELGISNVEVILYDAGNDGKGSNDVALDTLLTDSNGNYLFSGLSEGVYYVKLSGSGIPSGMISSTGGGIYDNSGAGAYEPGQTGVNDNDNGTQMGVMIMSDTIRLTLNGESITDGDSDPNTDLTVDFGLYTPQVFDLALVKTLKAGQAASFKPGDVVTFTINVLNQGTVTAYNVNVVDYIPSGLTLTDAAWTLNGSSATRTIASIAANSSSSVDISFTIDANFSGTSLVNLSEISSADDNTNPNDTPPTDVDSTPDTNPTNDGTPKDDVVNENGKNGGDEDDHDPSTIIIVQPTPTLALGNVVFNDTNNNGIKDNGELGISNVEVILYDAGNDGKGSNDVALDTLLTDSNGNYLFSGLSEGVYYVKLSGSGRPSGMISSTGGGIYDNSGAGAYEPGQTGVNDNDNGTQMGVMIMSDTIRLTLNGESITDGDSDPNTDLTVDFGLYTPQVFDLALVKTLKAGQAASFKPGDVVTFTINVLNQGTVTAYDVNVVDYIPSGLTLTDAAWTLNGSSATRTIASIAANSSSSVDISFTIDANFSGTSLVNLSEISSADDNTNPNDTPPTDVDSTPDTNPTNDGTPKDDVVNENGKTGGDEDDHDPSTIQITQFGSIGNYVWMDNNKDGRQDEIGMGIDGVTVKLYSAGADGQIGGGDDVLLATTVTSSVNPWGKPGYYLFPNLPYGKYYVNFPLAVNGKQLTKADQTSKDDTNSDANTTTGNSAVVTIDPTLFDLDKDNLTIDAGYTPVPTLSLGDLVWNDANNDGIKDATEQGLPNVQVILFDAGNNGKDATDIAVDTVFTNATGNYLFTGLVEGNYYVKLTGVGIPVGFVSSTGDGPSDTDASGAFEPSTSTDVNGKDNGTQMGTMVMSNIISLIVDNEPINDGDTDPNTNLTVDFGFYRPEVFDLALVKRLSNGQVDIVSPGDTVSYDLEVTNVGNVDAYNVSIADYLPTELVLADTNWIDFGGVVVLINPIPYIAVGQSETVSIKTIIADSFTGGDIYNYATIDVPEDTITENNKDTIKIKVRKNLLSIGDLVWNDLDNDGIKDPSETGIAGVTLQLYNAGNNGKDATDTLKATTITDADGFYIFNNLQAGNYYVKITSGVPNGMISSTGNGATDPGTNGAYEPSNLIDANNQDNGTQMGTMIMSGIVVLEYDKEPLNDGDNDATTNLTVDFGLYTPVVLPSGLSGKAFVDCNNDGVSTGDSPLQGVTVTLTDASNNTQTATTNQNGIYTFGNVVAGTYKLTFSKPSSLEFTTMNFGTNDAIDSDVDPTTGMTANFKLTAGQDAVYDAGYKDVVAPTFVSVTTAQDITVECNAVPTAVTLSATDNFDTKVDIAFAEAKTNGTCTDNYVLRRTWTASDDCGNNTVHVQTITVRDTQIPVFANTPVISDVTVNCNAIPSVPTGLSATDNCDTNVAINYVEAILPGNCADAYTLVRTWTATDNCNNEAVKVQRVTVQDNAAPTFTTVMNNVTVSCANVPAVPVVAATDICDTNVSIDFKETTTAGNCADSYSLTRTWTAVDNCNNATQMVQVITVEDKVAPVFAVVPSNVTITCGQTVNTVPTATDNCDKNVEVKVVEKAASGDCATGRTITREFTATDNCGNTAVFTQTVHVIDTEAPLLSGVPANVTVTCKDVPPPAKINVSDNCPDAVMIMFDEQKTAGDNCTGFTITRTWTAMDACGNSSSYRQTILIEGDHNAPTLTGVPANADYDCAETVPVAATVSASDDCDSNPKVTFTQDKLGDGCGYKLIRIWTATDKCGNTTTKEQTITVRDRTAPIISGVPANLTVDCADALPAVGNPVASDACDNNAILTVVETVEGDKTACSYKVIRTWTAADNCGNKSTATQTITVRDTKAPTLTPKNPLLAGVVSGSVVTVECDQIPVMDENDIIASDNCDKNPTVKFEEYGAKKGDCEKDGYSFLVSCRWIATDKCGNTASYEFTLKVRDTKAPIMANVPANLTLECGASIPTPVAPTVSDNCDNDIAISYREITTNGNCKGSYVITRTWVATDDCGNKSTATQTIKVQDTKAPVIANVPTGMSVTCGQTPNANQKPTVTDECGGNVTLTFADAPSANGGCLGSIIRTWTATDECGNIATATQTIAVEDREAPVFASVPANVEYNCGETIPTLSAIPATDNCDNNPTVTFKEVKIGTDCDYKLLREWTATDKCGNTTAATQTITVHDKTAPVMSNVPVDATIECGESLPIANPTATDICTADVKVTVVENVIGDKASCEYKVVRTWTATDKCGNTATKSQTITVRDTKAPVITPKSPVFAGLPSGSTITVECDNVPVMTAADAIATDICDSNPTIKFDEYGAKFGNCLTDGYSFTITCRWTATDKCGNTSEYIFTVKVKDTKAPVLVNVPNDLSLECGNSVPALPTVTATDNCSNNIKVTHTETPLTGVPCALAGSVIRTWTATDDCGNVSTKSQRIIITDTKAPIIIGVPADVTLATNETDPTFNVKGVDECDTDVKIEVSTTDESNGCLVVKAYKFTATDDCGNTATKVFRITRNNATALNANIEVIKTADNCGTKNGTVRLSPSNYTYVWSDGFTGATRDNLTAGDYTVTVSENCATKVITVKVDADCPCVTPELASSNVTDLTCGTTTGGQITFTMKDGNTSDYNFVWSTTKGQSNTASDLAAGDYKVTVTRKSNTNCSNVFSFTVKAKSAVNVFSDDSVTLEITDCQNGKAALCTNLTPTDISGAAYSITDNGAPYTGTYKGCKFDTTFYYNLSFSVTNGNYTLKNWTVNGKTFNGDFNNLNSLVALMNTWDPNGKWSVNAAGKIVGGTSSSIYGKMDIGSKNDPSFVGSADYESKLTPYAMALYLGEGSHIIVATSNDGCKDEIAVKVDCKPLPPTCKSFIAATTETVFTTCGTNAKLCIADLPFTTIADINIIDNGGAYTGGTENCNNGTQLSLSTGVHQLIFVKKDGCRDTLIAKVGCTTARIIKDTVYVGQKDTVCLDVAELLGNIKNITNIWPNKSGEHAEFALIPGSRCITCLGVEAGGTEEAAYVISDDQGVNDTTFFQITVLERKIAIPAPDAIDDKGLTRQDEVIVIDVLANDYTGGAPLTSIKIVDQPRNGYVFVNQDNKVVFTPKDGFCNDTEDEVFTYKICTNGGCDEAPVAVKVVCTSIKVFTGFSPNGDGVNDTFVIEGAIADPNNKLSVFNRYGNQVYYKEGYKNDWNGTWDSKNLPDGTYYYLYEDGKGETKAGYIQIQR